MHPHDKPTNSSRGFTMIELLVVVGIIVIMAALAMGGLSNVVRSSKLTNAAQRVADTINIARQTAAARNLPVEVRFYSLPYFGKTTGGAYIVRGMVLYIQDTPSNSVTASTNMVALTKPYFFPERIVGWQTASKLLNSTIVNYVPYTATKEGFGAISKNTVNYYAFTINPNGRLSPSAINTLSNYITLVNWEPDTPCNASTLPTVPKNCATIQVDPMTAKVTIIRP